MVGARYIFSINWVKFPFQVKCLGSMQITSLLKWSFLKEKIQKSHKMMKNNKKNKRYYLVELHSKTGVWKIWSQFRVKNLRLHDCITRLRSRTWSISIKTIQRILNNFSCMQPEYSSSHTHTPLLCPLERHWGNWLKLLKTYFCFVFSFKLDYWSKNRHHQRLEITYLLIEIYTIIRYEVF